MHNYTSSVFALFCVCSSLALQGVALGQGQSLPSQFARVRILVFAGQPLTNAGDS